MFLHLRRGMGRAEVYRHWEWTGHQTQGDITVNHLKSFGPETGLCSCPPIRSTYGGGGESAGNRVLHRVSYQLRGAAELKVTREPFSNSQGGLLWAQGAPEKGHLSIGCKN